MVSIENSVYHSQFSVFITKGFAVMRFSHHVLEVSCIPTLFILMCWAYVIKSLKSDNDSPSSIPLSPPEILFKAGETASDFKNCWVLCKRVNVGLETRTLDTQSLNNLSEPSSSVKWELGQRWLPGRYLHLYLHISLGEFFIVWGPGNSQGQILPQFAFSQSPKILEVGMSLKLGQLDAHSWDFVSPENGEDGETEIGREIDQTDDGSSISILKRLDQ